MRAFALSPSRRRAVAATLMLAACLLPARCASIPPPIRLDANAGARELLVGDWAGEYVTDEVDPRQGTIAFRLRERDDFAHGEVRMRPNGSREPYARVQRSMPAADKTPPPLTEWLTIRVVRGHDRSFSGELDSYWDPDRQCRARTTFRGTETDGVITGTFETIYDAPWARTEGRWWIKRR
ncbi:MAG TPA: hypothetical protein VFV98_01125 [Vicinamibacterales bacterium]|nr:hypothetical protein [Vicinamibacterales bacterium]